MFNIANAIQSRGWQARTPWELLGVDAWSTGTGVINTEWESRICLCRFGWPITISAMVKKKLTQPQYYQTPVEGEVAGWSQRKHPSGWPNSHRCACWGVLEKWGGRRASKTWEEAWSGSKTFEIGRGERLAYMLSQGAAGMSWLW